MPYNTVTTSHSRRPSPIAVEQALAEMTGHLATWRKLSGLTQAQLADRAGISVDALASFESGHGGLSVERFLRLLWAVGALDGVVTASDPYETDVGKVRAAERLPKRVRSRK